MRKRIAKISLIVASVVFFSGFLLLCYCPGWFALAAGFAAIAAWLGSSGVRIAGAAGVLISLLLTVLVAIAKAREDRKILAVKQRWVEKQATNLTENLQTNGGALTPQTNFK